MAAENDDAPAAGEIQENGVDNPEGLNNNAYKGPFHLDDEKLSGPPLKTGTQKSPSRSRNSIELVLRSTPTGAEAAVDGIIVGRTPTLWTSPSGKEAHQFTFVLPGYSVARYRFIPVKDGVVHGSLQRLRLSPPKKARK